MPVYEYLCQTCGDFTEMRPMGEYLAPQPCPDCGIDAPRVLLTAPHYSSMPRDRVTAHATNERARHAPMSIDEYKGKQEAASHGAGCSCCSGMKSRAKKRPSATTRSGAKGFPAARPWMISH